MKRIKYFAYYDEAGGNSDRNIVLSAVNKIDYIISSLNKIGYAVDIVSFAGIGGNKFSVSPSETRHIGTNTLKLFRAFSGPRIFNPLFRCYMASSFVLWIAFNCQKGEEIIVYHSLGYAPFFNFIQRFKHLKIIGEIEEIYQDVKNDFSASQKKNEYIFLENCAKYIFPSRILEQKINVNNKPHAIVHGIYDLPKTQAKKNRDGINHVVYAGTFDPNKGGAQTSILAAQYLPAKYHLHLIGFGTDEDIKRIRRLINEIGAKTDAVISFDGLKSGRAFSEFLQKCSVGLSTQNPEDSFNDTSFPSKVLTYMSNGLSVVSFRIKALSTSSLDPYIYYAEDNTPQAIAKAIIQTAESPRDMDSSGVLRQLNDEFLRELKILLA